MGNAPLTYGLILEDAGLRHKLARTIQKSKDLQQLFDYDHISQVVDEYFGIPPQVIILGINGNRSDLNPLRKLKERFPTALLIAYYDTESELLISDLIKTGVNGFVSAKQNSAVVRELLRLVPEGNVPMDDFAARFVGRSISGKLYTFPEEVQLTKREQEVLQCLKDGLMYKEAAERLFISKETVNNHVKKIYRKLHVSNRAMLMAKILPNAQLTQSIDL